MQPAAPSDVNYYLQLGLEYDPFAADAMPDFFFVGAQRRYLVQRTVHALYFSGATVLLIGVDGVGKTRTLDEIQKELEELADICRIEATVLMDAAEIRVLLAVKLGFPTDTAATNIELLHAFERMCPSDGDPQPIILAIDAAQLLSIDTLSACAALVASSGGRLRLLLVGEPDLALAWQQTQAGGSEILELAALDRNESVDYFRTKLQAAGYRDELPLSEAECEKLFIQTQGNFAAIDAVAPLLLQTPAASTEAAQRIKSIPVMHIGLAAAIVAVIIFVIIYRGDSSAQKGSPQLTSIAQPTQPKQSSDQKTVLLQLPASALPAVNSTSPAASSQQHSSAAVDSSSAAVAPEPNRPPEKLAVTEPKNNSELKAPAPKIKKDIANKSLEKNAEPNTETHKEKPESREKNPTATSSASFTADELALLAMPSSNYVLQLIGAESKNTVDKFTSGAGKALKLYCYRTQLRGKPWFIVVTGPYADKRAAQSALATLPEYIRKQQPWSRAAANVQADIRAHSR